MKQIARYGAISFLKSSLLFLAPGQYITSKNTNVQRLTSINVFQGFLYRIELLQKG